MSRLPERFKQDRALRNAALKVVRADIEFAREALSGKAVAGRVAGRIGLGAREVIDVARDRMSDHRGIFAGLVGLIIVWLARGPIFEALGRLIEDASLEDDPQTENGASAEDQTDQSDGLDEDSDKDEQSPMRSADERAH